MSDQLKRLTQRVDGLDRVLTAQAGLITQLIALLRPKYEKSWGSGVMCERCQMVGEHSPLCTWGELQKRYKNACSVASQVVTQELLGDSE